MRYDASTLTLDYIKTLFHAIIEQCNLDKLFIFIIDRRNKYCKV